MDAGEEVFKEAACGAARVQGVRRMPVSTVFDCGSSPAYWAIISSASSSCSRKAAGSGSTPSATRMAWCTRLVTAS